MFIKKWESRKPIYRVGKIKNFNMKKIFTILCSAMLTLSLSAQNEAGTILLSGASDLNFTSLSISSIDVDGTDVDPADLGMDDATNEFGLSVTGGYFLMDGLAAGLIIDYTSSSEGDFSSSSMTIGPMVRYYIGESGINTTLAYGIGSSSEDDGTDSYDGPSLSILSLGVGYQVMLSDNISINPSLAYNMVTAKNDDLTIKMGGIAFALGIGLHLGN
jgi:hypothetical protein